jgi:hypothetical protein
MSGPVLLALALAATPEAFIVPVGAAPATESEVLEIRLGEPGRLAVVVASADGRCWSSRAGMRFRRRDCAVTPPQIRRSARWVMATARAQDYDNAGRCTPGETATGCHDPIRYDLVELQELRGALEADVRDVPRLAAPGTHRIAVGIQWDGTEIRSAGPRGTSEADRLVPRMFEVVVRRDDTYVGYLTELLGVPFVLGPGRIPGVGHQTDRRLGADCVALAVYGRRRLGEPFGYVAPAVLKDWTTLIGSADALVASNGRVEDVGAVRPGDVLHFGFQTAVIARDNPPEGRLDSSDVVIHTFHGVAEEVALGQLPYRQHAVEVRRWPSPDLARASAR